MITLKSVISAHKDGDNYVCSVVLTDGASDIVTFYRVHPGDDSEPIHQELEKLLEDGKVALVDLPPPAPKSTPTSCQLWQFQAALAKADLLDDCTTAIKKAAPELQVGWSMGNIITRSGPLVAALISTKAITAKQADAAFVAAETLTL